MKALVKKVVPAPVWKKAASVREKLAFVVTTQQSFDPTPLRSSWNIDHGDIWSRKDIQELWDIDQVELSRALRSEDIFAGANPGDRRAIYFLIMALRSKQALEVGTFIGASLIYMVSALKRTGGRVDTVDIADVNRPDGPWRTAGLNGSPREMVSQIGGDSHVDFRVSSALDFMRGQREKYDFVFLDGDYSAEAIYREVSAALSVLSPEGVILLHNYYPNGRPLFPDGVAITGPFNAMKRISAEVPEISVHPLGALPWPTKQGSNITTLALVLKD